MAAATALFGLVASPAGWAQAGGDASGSSTLPAVTVTGRADPLPSVAGWGDVPLSKAPFQATVVGQEQLRDLGATRLSDLTRLDPAVSDAYNTEGYWDYLTVRGYVISNRFNYRRDGLPINAETSIPLDNKARVEVLKGTSGLQAGTSAPGGLVNLEVKRPTATPLRSVSLGLRDGGSLLGAVDISQRFGQNEAFGLRLNVAAEKLRPRVRDTDGERHLLSLAGDWRLSPDTLIEAEVESSRRSQRSVTGYSLLGDTLPAPADGRTNLNNQPWALPVVMRGDTASLRITQQLGAGWKATAHAATQHLVSDDRTAFGFGCYDAGSKVYYADRYCPNGDFDLYDFRSENERRRTDALELALHGQFQTGGLGHSLSAGVLRSRTTARLQQQAYNLVGTGNVNGLPVTPADPSLNDENTNRDEHSTELFLRDAVRFNNRFTTWLGLRHTRLDRSSVRTDGSRATAYQQSFTTPWLAASYALTPDTQAYASWGKGVESEVAPNRARYTNAGQALPALESRQVELGLKGNARWGAADIGWGLALFDIDRPAFAEVGSNCSSDTPGATCTLQVDGSARHRGLELNGQWRQGAWQLDGGLQWLHARREGSLDSTVNGKRPTNVPATTLKLGAAYDVATLPGLRLSTQLLAESDRMVLADNSQRIGGYARVDAALRYSQRSDAGNTWVWRAGVNNLFDRQAWRESPLQFGHVYLFPLAPRSLWLSVETSL